MNAPESKATGGRRIERLALGVDLEEFQPRSGPGGARCVALPLLVEKLLALFETCQVKATFFAVGETALKFPDLVRELSEQGHEIASHGHRHLPLSKLNPHTFSEDLTESLEVLNALSVAPVIGFRAPLLSITQETAWAYDILQDAGIRYSSSTFPGPNVQYGWPECPPDPHFRGRILEYPLSVIKIAGALYPAVGGAYFRIFPRRWIFNALEKPGRDSLVTCYFHPYDFDTEQPFAVHRELAGKPWLAPLLFLNRGAFLPRLSNLLDHTDETLTFSRHCAQHHEG